MTQGESYGGKKPDTKEMLGKPPIRVGRSECCGQHGWIVLQGGKWVCWEACRA